MAMITNEVITAAQKYSRKYPELTQADIAKLVGISASSVSNILNGTYSKEETIESQIPYETYRRLVMCEEAVKEILKNMKLATNSCEEEALFINYFTVSTILKRCVPEDFEKRINELKFN